MVLDFCMFTGRFRQLGEDLFRNLVNLRRGFEHCFCIFRQSSQALVFETCEVPDSLELACNPWFTTILWVSTVESHLESEKVYNNMHVRKCYLEFRNSQKPLAPVVATTPTVCKGPLHRNNVCPHPHLRSANQSRLLCVGEPESMAYRYLSDLLKAQTPKLVIYV